MKQYLKYIILSIIFIGVLSPPITCIASEREQEQVKIFQYQNLPDSKDEVTSMLHQKGFIAIQNVIGFKEARDKFFEQQKLFVALPDEVKERCVSQNFCGWAYGKECFEGIQDKSKGSYYANISDPVDKNPWPESLPEFRIAYINLATLIFNTAKEVLSLVGIGKNSELELEQLSATGRMLYYGIPERDDGNNRFWCGEHLDHGLFTGLCPAIYRQGDQIVDEPAEAGLYIKGRKISVPSDVLMFQVGETAELLSNGEITATEHYVKKPLNGAYERFAFALFCAPPNSLYLNPSNKSVIEKYQARLSGGGMTFEQWNAKAFERYYITK